MTPAPRSSRRRSQQLRMAGLPVVLLLGGAAGCTPPAADLADSGGSPAGAEPSSQAPSQAAGPSASTRRVPRLSAAAAGQIATFVDAQTGLAISVGDDGGVIGQPAAPAATQSWRLQPVGDDGTLTLQSVSSNQCLTAPGTEPGPMETSVCTNGQNQLFGIVPRDGTTGGWDIVVIVSDSVIVGPTNANVPVTTNTDPGNAFVFFKPYGVT